VGSAGKYNYRVEKVKIMEKPSEHRIRKDFF
jgi:hypothetical protein